MKTLSRRGLFGLHGRKPARAEAGFSLEDYYRRRSVGGANRAPLPAITPRAPEATVKDDKKK